MEPLPPSLHINNLLMPETIDAAVYNDLQRVIRVYGACRPWTVGAMDGAAARGRLDILQRLHETRTEGCSGSAFIERFSPWSSLVDRALTEAVKSGHDEMVEFLKSKSTTLCIAAERGELDVVRRLLDQCVHKPWELAIALHQAASNNHCEIVELLLSKILPVDSRFVSLKVHKRYKAIFTKLFFSAVKSGYTRIVKMLLDKGGYQFGYVGTVGRALMVATENNQVKVAELNVGEASFSADFPRYIESAAEIVANGYVKSEVVVGRRHVELAELLVGKCHVIDVDLALVIAVQKSDFEMARIFLAKCRGNQQVQLLTRTAANGQVEMTKILIENCSQHMIEEAVVQAELSDKIQVLGILLEKCDSVTLNRIFVRAAMENCAEVVKFLLEKVAEEQICSELVLYAACGRVQILEVLLERSSLSNVEYAHDIAVASDQWDAAKLLRDRGDAATGSVDIDVPSNDNTHEESMPLTNSAIAGN